MKKLMMSFMLAIAATAVLGADAVVSNSVKKTVRHRTPEEIAAHKQRVQMKHFGGIVRRENSAKGKVVFLNAQKKVPATGLKEALDEIENSFHPEWELKDVASVKLANPADDIRRAGGNIGVVLADSPELPALVTAPEVGWAIVNVAALEAGCKDAATLASRTRKELMRGFCQAGGAYFMGRDQEVDRVDIRVPSDLDHIKYELFGVDVREAVLRNLHYAGVTPWYQTTYKKACQEGWAPAPTNEFQKAIWDKVHELPTNPLPLKKPTK